MANPQSRFVTLSWMAPTTPNGIIIQYEVQYSVNSTTSLVNFTHTLMDTVGGLLPATIYTLQIRAYTRVGAGPFSDSITVTTLPERKLECTFSLLSLHYSTISLAPGQVSGVTVPVESIITSMFTLNWMQPMVVNGEITHYTVFYLPVSGPYGPIMTSNRRKRQLAQDGEFVMDFTGTSGTLTNLNGSVTYRIQVSAIALYNGIELMGDRSNETKVVTLEGSELF